MQDPAGDKLPIKMLSDRVLVKPEEGEERSKVGHYLPSTALDSQAVQGGRIVATGPGTPMPDFGGDNFDDPWRLDSRRSGLRFVPMQARDGDYALFFRKASVEITFDGERYLVVPQAAILALVREPDAEHDDPQRRDVDRQQVINVFGEFLGQHADRAADLQARFEAPAL